jgi:hypothetical protein
MLSSRYKQSRTLVRQLCRLPGEAKAEFQSKIVRLREHFERFNVDVSDLCQWLMSLRPKEGCGEGGVPVFWDFFLEPKIEGIDAEEEERDRWRLAVFDCLAEIRSASELAGQPLSQNLSEAIHQVSQRPKTPNAVRLFDRLTGLEPPHRLVLLKAAAEWIVARYQRGVENWKRQREEWEKEKREWEAQHPQLTEEARNAFTDIFKNLIEDPEGNGPKGLRRKNPRICPFKRLMENKDNCVYAGEKGHGPLCWKFVEFVRSQKEANKRFNDKHFVENAARYVAIRQNLEKPDVKRKLKTSPRQEAFNRLYRQKGMEQAKHWFTQAWTDYLKALDLTEQTAIQGGRLPHCHKIGGETFEKSKCEWNPHTHLCLEYKKALALLSPEMLQLEPEYREWRRLYLAGPRKPSFRYPSSRILPMPKIFGAGFHEIDLDRSVLRLRLDDMPQGEWIEFGFKPWPKDYRPAKSEVKITSIHVNFVGSRARAGFRFEALHRSSRFGCSQDDIDEIRSRQFPRQAQDQQFLEAARKLLIESFSGDAQRELRILAVDLGEKEAAAAVYQGSTHQTDVPLPIVKIDRCYTGIPEVLKKDEQRKPPPKFPKDKDRDWRGLRKEHVGHHLQQLMQGSARLAEHRQQVVPTAVTLRPSDYRGLTRHMRWMTRDWARHNAAQIVAAAQTHRCDLIVFESLRGFKPKGYDQMDLEQKRRLAFFAYGQVRRKVVEKAVERGMRVVTVPYGYSSRICSNCRHLQQDEKRWSRNKRARSFECECGAPKRAEKKGSSTNASEPLRQCCCKVKLDSDANAARVLARVFWGEIVLPTREELGR